MNEESVFGSLSLTQLLQFASHKFFSITACFLREHSPEYQRHTGAGAERLLNSRDLHRISAKTQNDKRELTSMT